MVQVEKIMKFGLHKGPSGVGRPLVVEVGTLCMLPIAAFRSILTIFIYESYGDCPHGGLLLVLYYSCGRGSCNLAVQFGDSPEMHASMHFTTVPKVHQSAPKCTLGRKRSIMEGR